ncbi:hypothetical protein AVEN_163647-1, partial [Araneus ventricosus]
MSSSWRGEEESRPGHLTTVENHELADEVPLPEGVRCRELQTPPDGPLLPKSPDDPQRMRVPQGSRLLLEREIRQ